MPGKLFRKLLSILLILCMFTTMVPAQAFAADGQPPTVASANGNGTASFEDVLEGAWYFDDVMWAYQNNLMEGTSKNPLLFSPNIPLSRAMFVTILWRIVESPPVGEYTNPFADISADAWYYQAVLWATETKIVEGYGNGRFGPDDNITREQLATLMMRFLNYLDIELTVTEQYLQFQDEGEISDWAKDAVQTMHKLGVILGMGANVLAPQADATRAQTAAVVKRFMALLLNAVIPDDDIVEPETTIPTDSSIPSSSNSDGSGGNSGGSGGSGGNNGGDGGGDGDNGGDGTDVTMDVLAYGLMDIANNSIQLGWYVTHTGGSFEVQIAGSENAQDFKTLVPAIPAQPDTDAYHTEYTLNPNDGDLYFKIIQKDGNASAASNIVKMTKLGDVGGGNILYASEADQSVLPEETVVGVVGYTDDNGNMVLEWSSNRQSGSFEVQISTNGEDFTPVGSGPAVSPYIYTPQGEGDLYFRVVYTDGEETVSSNIVKLIYLNGYGYAQETVVEAGEEAPEPDPYLIKEKSLDIHNGRGEKQAQVTVSMLVLATDEAVFEAAVSLSEVPLSGASQDAANAFELTVDEDFAYSADSFQLTYTFEESVAPGAGDADSVALCAPSPDPLSEEWVPLRYYYGPYQKYFYGDNQEDFRSGYWETYEKTHQEVYAAETGVFTTTLPEPGKYLVENLEAQYPHILAADSMVAMSKSLEMLGSDEEGDTLVKLADVKIEMQIPVKDILNFTEGVTLTTYQFRYDENAGLVSGIHLATPLGDLRDLYHDTGAKLTYVYAEDYAPPADEDVWLSYVWPYSEGYGSMLAPNSNQQYNHEHRILTAMIWRSEMYVMSPQPSNDWPVMPDPIRPPSDDWEPTSQLAKIVYSAGFAYDPDTDLLYARKDSTQAELGYSYFYDEGIALVSSFISCEPIYFIYDNKEWLIEAWKGQYGIETGAEIGVYNRELGGDRVFERVQKNYKKIANEIIRQIEEKYFSIPSAIKDPLLHVVDNTTLNDFIRALETAHKAARALERTEPILRSVHRYVGDTVGAFLFGFRSKLFECVDVGEYLVMHFNLYENGTDYLNYQNELFDRGPEEHWWLTQFDWGNYVENPHTLWMESTIWFPEEEMRDAFIDGWDDFDTLMALNSEYLENFDQWQLTYNKYDNNFQMFRFGLTKMGYQETVRRDVLWNYQLGDPNYPIEGYPVTFSFMTPSATQPFITTQLGPIVNKNNKVLVMLYNNLKAIVGCTTDDPNDLENCVLGYRGTNQEREQVVELYNFLAREINKVVDAAFSIAKAAMMQ